MPTALIAIDFTNDIVHPSEKISTVAKHVEQRAGLSRVNR
jgi:nicotinamidase-related amidase